MIKDITFGKFYPANSFLHKLDPRVKLLLIVLSLVFIFLASNFVAVGFAGIGVVAVLLISKVPLSVYFKNLKVILPILIFTFVINMFYTGDADAEILAQFWIFKITAQGLYRSVFMALRVVLLILISSVLTYTTTPNDLTDGLESLFSPLKYIGLGGVVHTLSMMMTIALRFIPTLIDETEKIMNAQKARGADFENGKISERIRAIIPILIPLLISAVRRAYDLAEAMESRCYNGGVGRCRMKKLELSYKDLIGAVISAVWCSAIIVLNIYF